MPRALTSLKYFCENASEYHVVAAGSLLGVALHPGTSFPVGKVKFMDLYPLDFLEFMSAMGYDDLVKLLKSGDFSLITNFKSNYIDLLKQYYYIGGMPAVVASFLEDSDYGKVRQLQKEILMAYEQDFQSMRQMKPCHESECYGALYLLSSLRKIGNLYTDLYGKEQERESMSLR